MADVKKDTILLEIETNFGDVINEMGQLKTRIDNLKNSNKELAKNNKELQEEMKKDASLREKNTKLIEINNQEIEQNGVVIRNLSQRQREYKKEIEDEIKARQAAYGSIKQMRLELIDLRREYEGLSKEDRESKGGQNMLKDIAKRTEELKTLEAQQLDFRRNVGNYADALLNVDPAIAKLLKGFKDLSGGTFQVSVAFKNAVPMIKSFGAQLLKLAINPVVLAILAVVTALKKLVDQFKMNDDAMTALQQLFASFQPIIDIFVGALDGAVKGLTKLIGWVTKGVTALMSLIPAFKESSEAAQDYVKAMDALEEKERQYNVQTAKNEAQISELRAKALQKDKYTAEQRKQFLEEAGQLQKDNLRMEKEVAQEKLRLAKEDAERRKDTSDDTKNKIADLEANVWRAVKSYNDGMRSIVKATQKAMKEIDKEVNKDITLPEYKRELERLKKITEEKKKAYENTPETLPSMFGVNGVRIDNSEAKERRKAEYEEALAEQNEYVENNEDIAKRNSKELENISKSLSKNLLQARKDYEQAVIDLMDESLEKQLKVLDEQHRQEIDALKEKLSTEQNLTKEARDLINKTIALKEKKWYEQRILLESNYWASVRENAEQTINAIFDVQSKLNASDPNRNIQQFIIEVRKQLLGVASEYENFTNQISESYKIQFQALKESAETALENGKDSFWGTEYSDRVKTLLKEISDGIGKFSKENVKTIDQFYNNIAERQRELGFNNNDLAEFFDAVKPFYARINEMYQQYIQIPKNYAIETANIIYNQMNDNAKKIQESIFKSFSFEGLSDDYIKQLGKEIKKVDDWLKTINFSNLSTPKATFEEEALFDELFEGNPAVIKVDWSKVGDDAETYAKIFGDELSNTLSGALKYLSKSDDLGTQLEWLVRNYEKALTKIDEYNEMMLSSYKKSGDKNFLNAMFDTSTIVPNLRKLYDKAMEYGKDTTDYDLQKLEAQKKYVGETDRELKIQNDVLGIENRRLEKKKQQETAQLNYAKSVRGEVEALEKETNQEITISRHEIANRQEIIQKRKEEAEQIRENIKLIQDNENLTEDEKKSMISELQKQLSDSEQAISKAQDDIRKLEERIAEMLKKFGELGFLSTEQVDETIKSLGLSIAQTDNQIEQNTQQTTQNVRTMWLNTFTNITGGLGQVSGAFNSLFTEMGEMNEKYNSYAEAAAYFSIMLQMAEGIATAVAKGMEMGWPAAAVMIPVGIATVVGGIASALSVYNQAHKPKYAQGGYVSGEKGVDKVNAWLSDGEYVIKRKRVKELGVPFLDALNEGKAIKGQTRFASGGYVSQATTTAMNDVMQNQMMMDMMTEAVAQIQPVVSVKEITRVSNKVKIKENIAKNK